MNDKKTIRLSASEIKSDMSGLLALSTLHNEIENSNAAEIIVNCERLRWIDAHFGAALRIIGSHANAKGKIVRFSELKSNVSLILHKNHTLLGKAPDTHGTTIPVKGFGLNELIAFANFSRLELAKKQMPKMSKGLTSKFFEGIDELFANASLHSKSQINVFSAGQFYPASDRLSFVITDGGIGIEGSISQTGRSFSKTSEAISWAMEMSNSSRSGDIPGGLGLSILKEFVRLNKGCLMVCSHTGYWESRGANEFAGDMHLPFPGTLVALEINTSDTQSYKLAQSVNPHDIW